MLIQAQLVPITAQHTFALSVSSRMSACLAINLKILSFSTSLFFDLSSDPSCRHLLLHISKSEVVSSSACIANLINNHHTLHKLHISTPYFLYFLAFPRRFVPVLQIFLLASIRFHQRLFQFTNLVLQQIHLLLKLLLHVIRFSHKLLMFL